MISLARRLALRAEVEEMFEGVTPEDVEPDFREAGLTLHAAKAPDGKRDRSKRDAAAKAARAAATAELRCACGNPIPHANGGAFRCPACRVVARREARKRYNERQKGRKP